MAIGTSQAFRTQNFRLLGNFYDKTNNIGNVGYRLNSTGDGTKWLADINENSGILTGGVLSATIGGTTFNVSAGTGQIVSNSLVSGEVVATYTKVSWNAQNNVALTYRTSHQFSYIYIDENGNLQQQNSTFTDAEYRNKIVLGVICHINLSTINLVTNRQNVAYGDSHRLYELISSFGPIKRSGLSVSAYSTNLRITRAAGTVFSIGCNYASDQFDADSPSISAANPALLCRVYQNGSGGFTFDVNSGSYYTDIDPNNYDNASGTLQTVNNNQWTIQRLYFFPNNPNDVIAYYGRAIYNSYSDAVGALSTESFSEATITAENAVFLGYLVVRGGATNLSTSADAVFFQSGAFRNIGAGGAGGGGGGASPTNLDDLGDVAISSPSDSQFLVYDNGTSLWKNASLTASSPITFTGVGTSLSLSVSNNAISFAKIQQISTSRVLGRISSGTGNIEELTGANIATIIDSNFVTNATNSTNLIGGVAGVIPYQSGIGTTAFTSAGTVGQVLLSGGTGAPTWANQNTLSVSSAATLTTTRTLWGQNFNGSANVTGSLTSVGDITGSSAITITAGGTNQNVTITPSGTGYSILNGNVGIGTNSPTQVLDVRGNIKLGADNSGNYIYYVTDTTRTIVRTTRSDSSQEGLFRSDGWGNFTFNKSIGVGYTIGSGPLTGDIYASGNVGIGTTSPVQKLHVVGDALIASTTTAGNLYLGDGNIYLKRDNTYDLTLYQGADSNSGLYLASAGSVYISLDANNNDTDKAFIIQNNAVKSGTELFRVQENGNVGIGTNNPSQLLHISSTGAAKLKITADTDNVTETEIAGIELSQDGGITTGTFTLDDGNSLVIGVNSTTSPNIYLSTKSDGTTFATSADAKVTILNGGNVGIGTTIPSQKLHVVGDLRVTGAFYDSNNDAGTSGQILKSTATGTDWVDISTLGVDGTGTTNYVTKWLDSNTITNSLIFDNGTNVGIGTAAPSVLFHLEGGGANNIVTSLTSFFGDGNFKVGSINGTSTNASGQIIGKIGSYYQFGNLNSCIRFHRGGGATDGYMSFSTNSDVERVRIDTAGNVGIGTTNPSNTLDVNGTTRVRTISASGSAASIYLTTDANGVLVSRTAAQVRSDIGAGTGSGTVTSITAGDGLSGGTITSSGTIAVDSTVVRTSGNQTIGGTKTFTAETYLATTSGNVGIGTTSPVGKLDVNGAIHEKKYAISNTAATAQWVKLGRLYCTQEGKTFILKAYIHAGYNARNDQDFSVELFFKTSNTSSVNGNGFAANSWYYGYGFNTHDITPKWVANAAGVNATYYDLYLYLPQFTLGSHYSFSIVNGDASTYWTDSQATGQTDPGSGSSTVLVADKGFNFTLGNVGIGSIAPANKLNVLGSASIGSATYNTAAPTNGLLVEGNVAIGSTSGYTTGGNASLTIGSSPYVFSIGSSNTELMYTRRLSSGIYQLQTFNSTNTGEIHLEPYGGNVGIGTTTVSAKLHVNSGAVSSDAFALQIQDATSYIRYIPSVGGGSYNSASIAGGSALITTLGREFWIGQHDGAAIRFASNEDLYFYNGGASPNLTILTGGNVGIGGTSPDALLHVATGHIHVGNSISFDNVGGWNKTILIDGTNHGRLRVRATANAGANNNINEAYFWVDNTVSPYSGIYADYGFKLQTGSGSLTLFAGSGYVGIGTTTPTNTLDINGSARIRSIAASGSAASIFLTTDANGVVISRTAAQVRSDIGAGTGNGTVTSITAGDGLSGGTITSSGTIAVDSTVVRTSGNQNIAGVKTFTGNYLSITGTNSNSTDQSAGSITSGLRLDAGEGFSIYGNQSFFGANLDAIIFQMEDGNSTSGNTDGGFVFRGYSPTNTTPTASNWMVIKSGALVGIGTTSPATALQIGQLTPTGATSGLQFGDDTGTRIYRSASSTLTMGGTFVATTFSGSGASLTNLPAGQLSGTIPSGVLANSTVYIGTTAIALNRASASQSLTGITSIDGNAATATTSDRLTTRDNRIISPSEDDAYRLRFGFTSWNNDNSSPYADYLHMRSYSDNTGGNDNLVMFRKDALGIRIWQQTYGSSTAYSSYKDVCWTDGSNTSGTWSINTTGSAATLTTTRTLWGQNFNGSANVTGSLTSVGNITGSSAITITAGGSNQNITLTPSGTGIIYLNANVGIGTTNPGGKLDAQLAGANLTSYSYGLDLKVTELSGGWARSHRIYNTNYPAGTSFFGVLGSASGVDYAYWTLDSSASVDATGYNSTKGIFLLTTGNVGIGVTNPSQKLHVAGSLRVTGAFYDSNNDAGTSGQILKSTATGTDWVDISSLGVDGTGTTNYITKWSDSNTITNSLLFDDGTKVGIGTASPTTKLDIRSVSANQIGLQIVANSTTGQSFGARIYAGTNSSDYAFTIFNASDSANLFHVRGDGNVGIGTTVPAQRLQVVGDLGFVGGITSRMLVSYTNLTNGEDWANSPISIRERDLVNSTQSIDKYSPNLNFHWANRVSKSLWMDSNGILNWGEYDTNGIPAADGYFKTGDINFISTLKFNGVNVIYNYSTDVYVNARVIRNDSASVQDGMYIGYNSTGTTGAHLRFFANGTNERMRIDASTGYVGIGTTSMVGKLDIYDNTNGPLLSFVRNANSGSNAYTAFVLRRDGGNNGIVLFTNSSTRTADGGAGNSTIRTDSGNLYLGAGGTQHVLTTAGDVGIGVTSPAAKLDIAGGIHLTGNIRNSWNGYTWNVAQYPSNSDTSPTYYIGFSVDTDNRRFYISNKNNDGAAADPNGGIIFRTGGTPSDRMIISYAGNVGIGTSSPATLLQIGTGTPTAATSGIQFGSDTGARIYRDTTTRIRTSGDLSVAGYIQTSNNNIYPNDYTVNLLINVGNSAQNAWINGISISPGGNVAVYNNLTAVRLISTQATGTAPLTVSSTTVVSNLNADYLDGLHSSGFFLQSGSWAGDLTSNGFTRESGMQMTGGSEFVILSKSGQGYVLVDGSYYAYEGGGFYSSYDSNYANLLGFRTDSITSIVFNPVKTTFTGSATAEDAIKTTNGRLQLGHHNSGSGVWFDTSGTARYWFAGLSGNNFRIYRGADYLTITDSGNVGIGTSNTITRTNIYGTLTVDAGGLASGNYNEGIRLGAANNGYSIITFGVNTASAIGAQSNQWWIGKHGVTNGFNIWNATTGDVLHILQSGNVGIGTISPDALLHVATGHIHVGNATAFDNTGSWNKTILIDGTSHGRLRIRATAYAPGNNNINEAYLWVDNSTTPYSGLYADYGFRLQTGSGSIILSPASNVGIGTSSPAVLLHIGGSSQTTAAYGLRFGLDSNANLYRSASTTIKTDGSFVVAGTLTELSALRYKENIVPISNILDKVCQIQPISYNKKGKVEKEYGVIAEEVNELFPELISRNADGDIDSVNYSRLTVLLIQAVKELKAEVEKLKNK